ncbi:MAG TPA: M1 family metallopeptidase [Candidatus Lustribacter sp.]|nr:M1 family metallopeptidase [Candidatus Lustribacter sp.]
MDADPYLPGHGDVTWGATSYQLELDYRMSSNRLAASARITARAHTDLRTVTLDLAAPLRVSKVLVDGRKPRKYAHRANRLVLTLAKRVDEGAAFTIEIGYGGNPGPLRGTWGEVGWEELSNGVIVAGQPNGAPTWFPCNDRPADKAPYRFEVTADSPYTVRANGVLRGRRIRGSRTTWTFEQAEPMATYLATLQLGSYETIRLPSPGSAVAQWALLPPRLRTAFDVDFGRQDAMMVLFERRFGRYPFAEYTVVVTEDPLEIPLEAQGLAVFGADFVSGRRREERLVAHELAHQWFGNSLTVAGWGHIWLNEGFACYAEWLWWEACGDRTAEASARQHYRRLSGLAQDYAIADPGPDLMFDDRTYKRGALTLHALRVHLGDKAFFELLRSWVSEHAHGVVTTADFVAHAQRHAARSGRPSVRVLLRRWLYDAALPSYPRA